MQCAGYVLTGGASRRMGRDKALLVYRERPLAAWVAGQVAEVCGTARLVGGGERYAHLGYKILAEEFAGEGPLSGIEAALRLGGAEWSLIVACDMAGVKAEWLAGLVEAARTGEARGYEAVYAAGAGGRAEPLCAVYGSGCLGAVRAALEAGERRASDMLLKLNALAFTAPWVDELWNVNTPEDWARAREAV